MKAKKWICLLLFLVITCNVIVAQKIKIETSEGNIIVELYPEKAPKTVANFLRYIDAGNYDGNSFYRVVRMDNQSPDQPKIEVIQGGVNADTVNLFPPIELERTSHTGLKHLNGTISMARSKPNSARSEFFICINPQPNLDFGGLRNPDGQGFAAFGTVTEGMEVVKKIQAGKTVLYPSLNLPQGLVTPIQIITIKRL
ncbi:MAG: peptidylprolyl isomerase [Cyclobacteriaceae bacterium]